jgi:Cd2+/Zn2+-exporting ATPase
LPTVGPLLLPHDKLAAVQEAFATAGAPCWSATALTTRPRSPPATVGVAMGSGGTAAALEAADLALMGDDLTRLPWAVRLAEATRGIVRFNVFLSVAAVVLLLTATLAGHSVAPAGRSRPRGQRPARHLNGVRLLSRTRDAAGRRA